MCRLMLINGFGVLWLNEIDIFITIIWCMLWKSVYNRVIQCCSVWFGQLYINSVMTIWAAKIHLSTHHYEYLKLTDKKKFWMLSMQTIKIHSIFCTVGQMTVLFSLFHFVNILFLQSTLMQSRKTWTYISAAQNFIIYQQSTKLHKIWLLSASVPLRG